MHWGFCIFVSVVSFNPKKTLRYLYFLLVMMKIISEMGNEVNTRYPCLVCKVIK